MSGKVIPIGGGRTVRQVLEEMIVEAEKEGWTKVIVFGLKKDGDRCTSVSGDVRGSDVGYAAASLQSLFTDWDRKQ